MRRGAKAALGALTPVVALAMAAPAGAQTGPASVLDASGTSAHAAAIGSGDAIVAWRHVVSGDGDTFQVCRVAAGQGGCGAAPVTLETPMTPLPLQMPIPLDSSRPWVAVDGSTVRVFGRATDIFMWTSTNGGETFGSPTVIHAPNPEVNPTEANPPLILGSDAVFSGSGPAVIAQAPTGGGESTTYATIPGAPGGEGNSADVDRDPASNTLVTTGSAGSGTFAGQVYFSAHASGDVNDSSTWTSAAVVDSGEQPTIAGGAGGLFVVYRAPTGASLHQLLARRWEGSGWSSPNPIGGPEGFANPDLAQTPAGILVTGFSGAPGANDPNVYVSFSLGGATWSTPVAVAQQAGATFERLRVVPTGDSQGFVLWDNGGQNVSLTPYALGSGSDVTPPDLRIAGPGRQVFDRSVEIDAVCANENCTVGAEGQLRFRLVRADGTSLGATRRVDLRPARPKLASAGVAVTLRLRVPAFIRNAVERALDRRFPVRATIVAGAVDDAQNLAVERFRTRLTAR